MYNQMDNTIFALYYLNYVRVRLLLWVITDLAGVHSLT